MKFILTILMTFTIFLGQSQVTLNNVTLPATLKFESENLNLNGGGIRTKLIFKLYTAGLYLDFESSDASEIINSDETMAIRMVITSNKINSNNMSEAIREGFTKSTGGNTKPYEAKIDKLIETFSKEAIEVKNIFDVVNIKGKGVHTYKNGQLKSVIEGVDFKKALFGIWLSDNPVSSSLKNGMLRK